MTVKQKHVDKIREIKNIKVIKLIVKTKFNNPHKSLKSNDNESQNFYLFY